MRCDQVVGLNDWANHKVNETVTATEVGQTVYPNGRVEMFNREVKVLAVKGEPYDKFLGMNYDEYNLNRYTLPDGTVYEEYIQADPWSYGPMFFLALKDTQGNVVSESLWSDSEIENYIVDA